MAWRSRYHDKKSDRVKSSDLPQEQVNLAERVVPAFLEDMDSKSKQSFYVDDMLRWIRVRHEDIVPYTSQTPRAEVRQSNPGKPILDVQNLCYHLSNPASYWIENTKTGKKVVLLEHLSDKTSYRIMPDWKERLRHISMGAKDKIARPRKTTKLLKVTSERALQKSLESTKTFEPNSLKEAQEKTLTSILVRRGQAQFRDALIEAYGGKCAITGCDATEALEAAHIMPYKGAKWNHPQNGLLLRADIHTLFDLNLLAIDTSSHCVILSSLLLKTAYQKLNGKRVKWPHIESAYPNKEALDSHASMLRK